MGFRILLSLLCLSIVLPTHAESLYKCISASKEITYTNQPCSKLPGLKEVKTIEVDTGPPVEDNPKPENSERASPATTRKDEKTRHERVKTKRILKLERADRSKCDKLSDQISDVMDKMDAARHSGYTLKQEAAWNDKIRQLNAKKRRLNCF
jgi:hypothetical protein